MMKENRRFTYDEVKKYFEDNGCVLISNEYINNRTKLDYICECGEKSSIAFGKFKSGQRCRECSYIKTANKKRLKYEDVKKYFEDNDCVLLSEEYTNSSTPLKYICECGNHSKISFSHFKNGVRCAKCAGNEKYTYEEVKSIFEKGNCILISNVYINSKEKLEYICSCGNHSEISLDVFLRGCKCYECRNKAIGESKRHSYEYVKSVFDERGFTLLSKEYLNSDTPLDYICHCGTQSTIRFNDVLKGVKCQECRKKLISELISGENHYAYNPNLTDEDRMDRRIYPEYKQWRKEVYERDNYTCLCCGEKGTLLNAHHKDGYHWCKERRIDIDNGATLCESCHFMFHKTYGSKNNTEEQYDEFIEIYKELISESA